MHARAREAEQEWREEHGLTPDLNRAGNAREAPLQTTGFDRLYCFRDWSALQRIPNLYGAVCH